MSSAPMHKFSFHDPASSRPGVILNQARFDEVGAGRVPFAGGRFVVGPGATSRPDTHDVSEVWMLAQGSGLLNYDGADHPVSAGDCVFFEPRKTHFIHNPGTVDIVIHTVWWLEDAR